ncbi:aldose 1-epimerase family protein [Tamlana sp. 2_MG-2023]|uniref:aldose 1-epimerase family protein n=1 Tax=unclassified Tamlana TaxID=2614803 RepID=UPI0026E34FC2|nr:MULTISPECIES: aldose 1-epimerase family protein [unclassified Tamlana]MDO6758965.1 aldose 1-epimerase family protein [Tamlana sp. 2_MG-2023]MDO6789664.1 aldose 1-epimerase family protein [Tamlana sp. 1_MG-2023]
MFTLENDLLKIAVKKNGAELCQIQSTKHDTQFMWDANPDVWGSFAPNLFPIIGALKNGSYHFSGESYSLPKHGIIRNNTDIELHEQSKNSLTFKLIYNNDTLKVYPFKFEFYLTYTLKNSTITLTHSIKNVDSKTMYFSLGGHPAFKCPLNADEIYEDYQLEFEHEENSSTHLINMENGLISSETKPIFNASKTLALTHDLFNADALIFKDLKSKKVTLKSKNHGAILSVSYKDFPYLGIWAKPTGDYVCIEPWLGIADHENTNQDFKTKEGILQLELNKTFAASYTIEIDPKHLT